MQYAAIPFAAPSDLDLRLLHLKIALPFAPDVGNPPLSLKVV